jgi:hypothetical protein
VSILVVSPSAHPLWVAEAIPDQWAATGREFAFPVGASVFQHVAPGAVLGFAARRSNGLPLPAWLSFDATSRTFRGRPGMADVGTLVVTVTASDANQPPATASDNFTLTVGLGWQNPTEPLDVDNDRDVAPLDVLLVINFINAYGAIELPRPAEPQGPKIFVDVDGNNWVTANDVLLVVNAINRRAVAGGAGESPVAENDGGSTQDSVCDGLFAALVDEVFTDAAGLWSGTQPT